MQPPNILLDIHGGSARRPLSTDEPPPPPPLSCHLHSVKQHSSGSKYSIFGVTSRKKVKCIEKFRTKSVTEIVEEFVSNVIVILTFTSAASFQMSGQSLSCDNGNTMVTVPHNGCRARNKLSTF